MAVDESSDPEAEERRGVFKQADIYKMHTYRDAVPNARSVWILYPGTESRFFDIERGRLDDLGDLGATPEGVGAIASVPEGTAGPLRGVVDRLVGE